MKKYAEGGIPKDAINPDAMRGRAAPPKGKQAPKRKMTREEIMEQMRRAGQMGPQKKDSAPMPRMASGGKVRGDGICRKGHTKGRMV
jgi:hypothetical protein